MAKTLQDYITESEAWVDQPAVGDDFAITIREECLVESHIVDVVQDGVVLAADDRMIEILESYGLLEEGVGQAVRRGLKSLRRGAQGWGGSEDSPRELVRRNRAHPDQTVLDLRKGADPLPGSPQALQARVLDREIKKRWGMDENSDPYRREVSPPSTEEFEEGVSVDIPATNRRDGNQQAMDFYSQEVDRLSGQAEPEFEHWLESAKEKLVAAKQNHKDVEYLARVLSAQQVKKFGGQVLGQRYGSIMAGKRDAFFTPEIKDIMDTEIAGIGLHDSQDDLLDQLEYIRSGWSNMSAEAKQDLADKIGYTVDQLEQVVKTGRLPEEPTDVVREMHKPVGRAVDSQGRTQQQWLKAVTSKFPDAKIIQAKMIDGPMHAFLPNGKKISWIKVEQQGVAEEQGYDEVSPKLANYILRKLDQGVPMSSIIDDFPELVRMMDVLAHEHGLHPDDDFEEIEDVLMNDLEDIAAQEDGQGLAESSDSEVEQILQEIKQTRQERAEGVRRGHDVSKLDQDLDLLEQQLADAERRGQETDRPMHEQAVTGVAEAFGPLPQDDRKIKVDSYTVEIGRVGRNRDYIGYAWHDSQGREHYEEVAVGKLASYDDLLDTIRAEIQYQEGQYVNQGVLEGSTPKVKRYSGKPEGYTFSQVQQKNYDMLVDILARNGMKFTKIDAQTYPGERSYIDRHRKSTPIMLTAFKVTSPALEWHKYEGFTAGGGRNTVKVGGKKMKLTDFLRLTPKQQNALLKSGMAEGTEDIGQQLDLHEAQRAIPGSTAWNDTVARAQASGETSAAMLYNMFQNVPKRHFLQFLKDVGITQIPPRFLRELQRAETKGLEKNLTQDQDVVEGSQELLRIRELAGMPPAAMTSVTEGGVKNWVTDLYYEFRDRYDLPRDMDDDAYLSIVAKFLNNQGIDPDKIEDIGELFVDMRDREQDDDHDYANQLDAEQYDDERMMEDPSHQEIDYDSLVVDGIDTGDYPDFSDAYFASGEYTDGTPLPDEVLDQLTSDSMLLRQHLEKQIYEAKYRGRKVPLGKPFLTPDGPKKRSVYVKNPKGNVVKVNFGDKKLRIKKSNPKRRKSFRARHNCANPGPRHKARYWSCRAW